MVNLMTLSAEYGMRLREKRTRSAPTTVEDTFLTAEEAFRDGFRLAMQLCGRGDSCSGLYFGEHCRVCGDVCELGPTGICIKCHSQT